jgi:ribosomal protein S27AE
MVEGRGEVVDTDTSCPRCGAGAPAGASSCGECGFVFFEAPARRSLPRPSPVWTGAALLVLAGGVALALLLSRDQAPEPPAPVPAISADRRLEQQLRTSGVEDVGGVDCQATIRARGLTRCELLYDNGDTQLLLVDLTADGELDIQQPYPAQRRPGG